MTRHATRRAADVDLHLHGDALARGARDDLAVNVLAGGPPPWLRDAVAAALGDLGAYPDERPPPPPSPSATAAAPRRSCSSTAPARPSGSPPRSGRGARSACTRRSPSPRSRCAPRAARRAGVVLDAPWALRAVDVPDDADLVVVGNPTNPTGVLHRAPALAALCRPGRVTLVDESFMDFVPGEPETLAAERELPGLVVARSLTKLHAIPGLRAGYLLAPVPLAARLRAQRPAWSVNALALAAIAAIAAHPEHAEAIARDTARQRADLVARLTEVPGATVAPGRRQLRARPPARGGARGADACASRASRCARAPPSPASPPTTCASPSATRQRTRVSRRAALRAQPVAIRRSLASIR